MNLFLLTAAVLGAVVVFSLVANLVAGLDRRPQRAHCGQRTNGLRITLTQGGLTAEYSLCRRHAVIGQTDFTPERKA